MEKKERLSNFELLRIICMIGILVCHSVATVRNNVESPYSVQFNFLNCMAWIGGLGNYLFMLISGYFLVTSKFSWKKFFKLWIVYFFYCSLISLLFGIKSGFGRENFLCFMPFTTNRCWYLNAYMVFFTFVPFLNVLQENMDRKMHGYLCVLLLSILCLASMKFFNFYKPDLLFPFFVFYFVAAYIRKYDVHLFNNKNVLLFFGLFTIVLKSVIAYLISAFTGVDNILLKVIKNGLEYFTVLLLPAAAIFIFLYFRELKFSCRLINLLSSTTLSIYLMHQVVFMNNWMWTDLLQLDKNTDSSLYMVRYFAIILLTFFTLALIDLLRQLLFYFAAKLYGLCKPSEQIEKK